jgi:hypothetical protein
MIARWAPQPGWSLWLPATNPPGPEIVTDQPSPPIIQVSAPEAGQAPSVALSAPDIVARAAPAGHPPDPQQLEAMARDLAAVRQSIERLAAAQHRMARNIARWAEQDIRPTPA